MNKAKIEELAEDTRKLAQISTPGINDIFDVCSTLGIYYIRYPLTENGILGAALKRDSKYIVFSNSSVVYSREIFTVAHEMGHIKLGHLSSSEKIEDSDFHDSNDHEASANYFAACFLMPEFRVREIIKKKGYKDFTFLDIVSIQSEFNVSFDTTINRLHSLNLLGKKKLDHLKTIKQDYKISNILKSFGNDGSLCYPTEVKAISFEYLKWIQYNYLHQLISKQTVERALNFLDIPIDSIDLEIEEHDNFNSDAFWEDDSK